MKPESRPSGEQGLANAVSLAGPFITSSSRHLKSWEARKTEEEGPHRD